jgi:hypothetical protein
MIANTVCENLAKNKDFYQDGQEFLESDEISWIVELIHQEDFYPVSLTVSRTEWNSAVTARAKAEMWEEHERKDIQSKYDNMVSKRHLEAAHLKVAKSLGIDKISSYNTSKKGLAVFLKETSGILLADTAPWPIRWFLITILFASIILIPISISVPKLGPLRNLMLVATFACIAISAGISPILRTRVREITSRRIKALIITTLTLATGGFVTLGYKLEAANKPNEFAWFLAALTAGLIITLFTEWRKRR